MRLIDADEFLNNEIERCGCIPLIGTCTLDNESLKYRLNQMPTIDPKDLIPKGKWISKGRKLECSICHHRVYLGTDDEDLHKVEKGIRKYCSWCGAEMEVED